MATSQPHLKQTVAEYWEGEVCGSRYAPDVPLHELGKEHFESLERTRYLLEPMIPAFAGFSQSRAKQVLEIGVGTGVDFHNWLRHGARPTGVDLTHAAVEYTRRRLQVFDVTPDSYELITADAEHLPIPDNQFDIVYAWGVLHHTPDTEQAFRETLRVLKPGGHLRAMIYHVPSWTGWSLWFLKCLLKGKPFCSPKEAMFHHLESPGTKAYTLAEARSLVAGAGFADICLQTRLGPGDLLTIKPSNKYQSRAYRVLWRLYPRWLVAALGDTFGAALLITARKPATNSP